MRIKINGYEVEAAVEQIRELLDSNDEATIKINANNGKGNVLTEIKK